jgi:hypothetical protein
MWQYLLLALLPVGYLIYKFIAKPLMLMKYYEQFKGAVRLPFIPIMGAFGMLKPAYDRYGDEQYPTKTTS